MMNFKLGGIFENLKGLIIGSMSDMQDNKSPFGKNAYEIIFDAVKNYNFPVCFDFPAGHTSQNNALILGKKITLAINNGGCSVKI